MNNKKYIISAITLLGFAGIAHSAIYQCRTCQEGTYSDGTSTSCTACPAGAVCPEGTGAPIYLSKYKDKIFSACGEIGKEIAINTGFASSNFVMEMVEKQKVKINSDGNIIKKGASGYNSARAYHEVNCYDLDGYYESDGYKSITSFIQSKICNDESEVKNYSEAISSSATLSPGVYKIEVAGAGGGGGGGVKCGSCKTGGNGGNGDLKTTYVYVINPISYSYTIGAGGSGGDWDNCHSDDYWGSDGKSTTFKFTSLSIPSFVAEGGKGAEGAYRGSSSNHSGQDGKSAGNGKGGQGGGGRGCDNRGYAGSNGFVKIYQVGMRKYGCASLRPSTSGSSGGGCSSGSSTGGCR